MENKFEIRGDITAIILVTAKGERLETLIDTDDLRQAASVNGRWRPLYNVGTRTYYVVAPIREKYKKTRLQALHRLLMEPIPEGKVIDHINHDTLDNRSSINLRTVTPSENMKNKRTGVSKQKRKYVNWRFKNGKIVG